MDAKRSEFLTTMIAILKRLHATSMKHEEPLLAGMLAIAQTEAEDALRHAGHLGTLAARRAARSSAHTWRACDRPEEEEAKPAEGHVVIAGADPAIHFGMVARDANGNGMDARIKSGHDDEAGEPAAPVAGQAPEANPIAA